MNEITETRGLKTTGLTIAVALLAGCSVVPKSHEMSDVLAAVDQGRQVLSLQEQEQTIIGVITLQEAMARALTYNRERRVQAMEAAIASTDLDMATFDMLPALAASAGYRKRSNLSPAASGAYDEATNQVDFVDAYSVSADTAGVTGDVTLSWNALDFGLSYVRAQQNADRVLIARERERRAVHNLILDVRYQYWRAASAQSLLQRVEPMLQRVQSALKDSRTAETKRLQNPIDALTYQRELLEARRTLEAIQRDLQDARTSLATLMGLTPGTTFRVADIATSGYEVLDVRIDIDSLEVSALARRPELMEARYNNRISAQEARATLLRLMPNINIRYGRNYDDSPYLYFNEWSQLGVNLSANLLNVFKIPSTQRWGNNAEAVSKERELAVMASVMAQVHLSSIAYQQSREEFTTATEYYSVVNRIAEQLRMKRQANASSELNLIREELNELVAQLRRDVAYAQLQASYGRIFSTAGLDPLPEHIEDTSLVALGEALHRQFERWKHGEIGLVASALHDQIRPWTGPGEHRFAFTDQSFVMAGNLNYKASMVDGTPLPNWLKFESQARQFSGNPPSGVGSLTLTVVASNGMGAQARDNFELVLQDVNDTPVLDVPPVVQLVEDSGLYTGSLRSVDPDGDELTFGVSSDFKLPAGMQFAQDGTWSLDTGHSAYQYLAQGKVLKLHVPFTVRDPFDGKVQGRLSIELAGRNDVPKVQSTPPMLVRYGDEMLQSQLIVSDADEGAQVRFEALHSAPGFQLTADGRWSFNPTAAPYADIAEGESKTIFMVVLAKDDQGGVAQSQIQITVEGPKYKNERQEEVDLSTEG